MIIFWLTFNFNFLLCKIAQIATEWTKALIPRIFGNIDFDGYCSWLFYVKCVEVELLPQCFSFTLASL